MSVITCYYLTYGPGDFRPQGCFYEETNLTTGEVTGSDPSGPPSGWPILGQGEILGITVTVGWGTEGPGGGTTNQGQVDLPTVESAPGTGDATTDQASIQQAKDQATFQTNSAACVKT